MRPAWWAKALILLLALALASCGGGDGDSAGEDGDSAGEVKSTDGRDTTESSPVVTAKIYEEAQAGIPADLGQWMVDIGVVAGDKRAFTVKKVIAPPGNANFQLVNPQAVEHKLTVDTVGTGAVSTPAVREGSGWLRVSLFEGVRYVFYCSIPGHRKAGMEGTIEVDPQLEGEDLQAF